MKIRGKHALSRRGGACRELDLTEDREERLGRCSNNAPRIQGRLNKDVGLVGL